ncbi:hypothetical protein OSTOST_05295 [Ostertagia ostertagi]
MLKVGDEFRHRFSYTQQDVNDYARISGDTNPLHTDEAADHEYEAVVKVKEIFPEKNRITYECAVYDPASGDQTIAGEATLLNKKQYIWD